MDSAVELTSSGRSHFGGNTDSTAIIAMEEASFGQEYVKGSI